ncbi:Peptidase M8 [Trypanosoma melophagium]|uniref:Peptidase M8 n=1 Tax=Trypanosoma melophagium TaxID=715481 RepID=UPI00351AAD57|nr:Peptidase M8 [Trypanosoma melophagium]
MIRFLLNAVLLLFMFCTIKSFAVTHTQCSFDDIMRKGGNPISVVREVPHNGQGAWESYKAATSESWAPIRIVVSTEDLQDSDNYCSSEGDYRMDYSSGLVLSCASFDVLTTAKKNSLIQKIIPVAVKLHTDRLLVHRERSSLVVPAFTSSVCLRFTVPNSHHTTGVANADTVLYVASTPTSIFNPSWAIPCAQLGNRFIAGVMNFGAYSIDETRVSSRHAAHEIAHILGFEYTLMNSLGMTTNVSNIRGKDNDVVFVSSEKTKAKTRNYYNCSTLEGMELEDDTAAGVESHWKRRNAKDEMMTVPFDDGVMLYTALTMATFEDMGVYKANWGMEEPMYWGNNSGCDFLNEKCMENNITKYPNMFCNTTNPVGCIYGRMGLGNCAIDSEYAEALPAQYQYFTSDRTGGFSFLKLDYCPVRALTTGLLCASEEMEGRDASLLRPDSWCLDGESLVVKYGTSDTAVGGICAGVKCEDGVLSVLYRGSNEWHDCPNGSTLTPVGGDFVSGSIVCPSYSEVCIIAPNGSSFIGTNGSDSSSGDSASFPTNIFISLTTIPFLVLMLFFFGWGA